MTTLSRQDRTALDKAIQEARDISEEGARKALISLGIEDEKKPAHLTDEKLAYLRRRIRVVLRRLGSLDELIRSVAYEQWHRMLFARFLIENDLLIHPEHQVAVSHEDLIELAHGEQIDPWELAARYASAMLPGIFKQDDPLLMVTYAPEDRNKLRDILSRIPEETFRASDALGWTYQFWQTKKKDEVNRSGVKIGATELPSQTQLFTEPYMVQFLLDNSLGAWWAGKRLREEDLKTASSEDELRQKASLPGVPLTYLRFVQNEDRVWAPAAGTFSEWPASLSELKILDPCCGSGHFLIAELLMLVPMRMEAESQTPEQAIDAVIAENLHGLEIDERCVEIAAFALALTAWTYPNSSGYRSLPDMPIACSGLAITSKREEWGALAGDDHDLAFALDLLYEEFAQAPILGSLIDPMRRFREGRIVPVEWESLGPMLKKVLSSKRDEERDGIGIVAHGLARAAAMLTGRYHLIATNVPYLARGKQNEILKEFCSENYSEARNDIATVFLDRCLELCYQGGTADVVMPQNWLFLTAYTNFREKLLKDDCWHIIARLGPKGFQTPMWDFNVQLIILSRKKAGNYGHLCGFDVSEMRTPEEKDNSLIVGGLTSVNQRRQLENPDARVAFNDIHGELLEEFSNSFQGIKSGDDAFKRRYFWEISGLIHWIPFLSTVNSTIFFGGMESVINWKYNGEDMARLQGVGGWMKNGIAISQMSNSTMSSLKRLFI